MDDGTPVDAASPPAGLRAALDDVERGLRAAADTERAAPMAAYMKHRFPFLGVPAPERKRIEKPLLAAARAATADEIIDVAHRCWSIDERELQYVGTDLLRSRAAALRASDLVTIRELIVTKSWWDTVDALAAHVVGPMVAGHPHLAATMDTWIHDENLWVRRTALLHQLTYRDRTDAARLFAYALECGGDPDFFIRKAIGWALRNYARVAPDDVRTFVAERGDALSSLTRREATKHL